MKYKWKKINRKNDRKVLLDLIESGKGDDAVIAELKSAIEHSPGPDELRHDVVALVDIALTSDNIAAITWAVKALELDFPLDPGQEKALERRALALALLAVGATGNYPVLAEAISSFVFRRASYDAIAVRPFIPALLSFLDYDIDTTGANSYYSLIALTHSRPDYFQPYANILIDMLDSPRNSTVAFASKIIAALAREHQEYVVGGEKALWRLSSNHPQPIVRKAASDALDAIRDNLSPATMDTQAEHSPDNGEKMSVNPGDSGCLSSTNTWLNHPSESNIASDISSFPAHVAKIVDALLNLKLHVNLSIINHASDDDEINAVIGDFSEIAPLIKNEFRAQMETAEVIVWTHSADETMAVAMPNAFEAMLVEDAFRKDTSIIRAAYRSGRWRGLERGLGL